MQKKLFLVLLFTSIVFGQTNNFSLVLYFETNSSEISVSDKNKLDNFCLYNSSCAKGIKVFGFCDDVGSDEKNFILSNERASSVAQYLKIKHELKADEIVGKGKIVITLNQKNITEQRANNRKVIIEINCISTPPVNRQKTLQEKELSSVYKTFNDKLLVGDKIIMKKLLFKGSLTNYDDEEQAEIELAKVVAYLKENPDTFIEIQGHVCCITNSHGDAYDRETKMANLSQTRAKKIFDYLISKDISAQRMSHKGYGRKQPIPGGMESENKRVEILITKI